MVMVDHHDVIKNEAGVMVDHILSVIKMGRTTRQFNKYPDTDKP